MGKSTISMVIFNSYVKLPEGTCTTLKWPSTWRGHHCFVLVDAEFHQLQAGKLNGYNFSAEARHASERYALRFTASMWRTSALFGTMVSSTSSTTVSPPQTRKSPSHRSPTSWIWYCTSSNTLCGPHVSDGHSPWGCGGLLLHYERHRNNPIMNHIIIYIY